MSASSSRVLQAMALLAGGAWLVRQFTRYSLRGKNVLLTGGSRGLGLEIARVLVARGANVALVARDAAEIDRAEQELVAIASRSRVVSVVCDLRDGPAIDAMVATVRAKLGPVDVLINNAGAIQVGPLDAMTVEDFEEAMRIHCFAPLRTMLALRADLRERKGRIANIASVGGLVAVPHLMPYSVSKFALVGLSQGMHAELAPDGIVVTTVAPGLMRTGSPRNASFKGQHAKEHAWFAVSDSLPGLSMSASRAARRIVDAIEYGQAHVVLGLPAQLAALMNGVAPGLVARAMSATNALLPTGNDREARFGYESASALAPSILTTLTEAAAARNNEL